MNSGHDFCSSMVFPSAGAVRCAVLLCTNHRHSFAGKHFPQKHQGDFFQEQEQFTHYWDQQYTPTWPQWLWRRPWLSNTAQIMSHRSSKWHFWMCSKLTHQKELRGQWLFSLSVKISYINFVHPFFITQNIPGSATWLFIRNSFMYSVKPLSLSNCLQVFGKKEQLWNKSELSG